jgi:lipopolysaccharide transport system permease protein
LKEKNRVWDIIIEPDAPWFDLKLRDIWRYRDLLLMFVRRDIVTVYKQTILGPLWFFIQPLLTTLIFVVIFGRVARISTDGLPPILFYMAGIVAWNYFAECFKLSSDVFKKNEQIFGKVYFPRAVVPLSIVISNLMKFFIQMLLFAGIWIYYTVWQDANVIIRNEIWIFPWLILILAGLGMGFGMLISSLTTKYRDLSFLVQFGIQLAMYATPVVYPLSSVPQEYKYLIYYNPMTPVIESFRYVLLGTGTFSYSYLGYATFFMIFIFLLGLAVFNRVEKSFLDTV